MFFPGSSCHAAGRKSALLESTSPLPTPQRCYKLWHATKCHLVTFFFLLVRGAMQQVGEVRTLKAQIPYPPPKNGIHFLGHATKCHRVTFHSKLQLTYSNELLRVAINMVIPWDGQTQGKCFCMVGIPLRTKHYQ